MIIGVDAGCLGIKDKRLKVGVYQVVRNLLEKIGALDTSNTYLLYSFYKIDENLVEGFGPNFKNVVVKPARGWTKIWLPLQLLRDKPDVFLGLNQSLPLKLPFQEYRTLLVVYDILFEYQHKLYKGSWKRLHQQTEFAVKLADIIIAISLATKRDVVERYGIDDKKIRVSHLGKRTFPRPRIIKHKKPFFLFVGSLKPSKNIPTLLKAFHQFLKQTKSDIDLVLVGGDKWLDEKIAKTMEGLSEETKQHIIFKGGIDDATMAGLYKDALCFVSPSISEGFGLPFLEAMSFGTPVIGPNTGAVPEVVEKAGILVDPTDKKSIILAMESMLDEKIKNKFSQRALSQAKKYNWDNFAEKLVSNIENDLI